MGTEVIRIEGVAAADAIEKATGVLARGGLVSFPTETVYGVAVRADRPEGVAQLRKVKQREPDKAFTVHLGDPKEAEAYVPALPGVARRLIRKAWPGPVTLIVPVKDPSRVQHGLGLNEATVRSVYYDNTIGLRCPDHVVAAALLRAAGGPVVAASANPAGDSPARSGEEVLQSLDGQVDLLLDAGSTRYAQPSTIVRVADEGYSVLREGVFSSRIIDRLAKLHILFVCTGNTCRSPMAEGLAEKILAERLGCAVDELPSRGVIVSSAGISGGIGGASEHAITVLARQGIDISQHASTALSADHVRQADYTWAMTRAHRDAIVNMVPSAADRVALLLDGEDVADPVGGTVEDYESCGQTIEKGVRARMQEVIV